VVHERMAPSDNGQQITGRNSPANGSPRVERARSEPPKAYQPGQHQHGHSRQPHPESIPETGGGLQVPAHSKIATSASSPSVPAEDASQQEPPPVPPRSPVQRHQYPHPPRQPQQPQRSESPNLRKQSAPPGVRHIPIFVEGRDAPVTPNRPRSAKPQQQAHHHQEAQAAECDDGSFAKPSDYYPEGVKRVPRGAGVDRAARPGAIPGFAEAAEQGKNKASNVGGEPTSPLSPPTGPIPMGCSPSHLHPQGVNANGPQFPNQKQGRQAEEVDMKEDKADPQEESAKASEEQAAKRKPPPTPEEAAVAKVQKVKEEVQSLRERIEQFKGEKTDKEYLYLDEMLTRQLLMLDGVETFGKEDIRSLRKESINAINRCLSLLDSKAKGGKEEEENDGGQVSATVLDALADEQQDPALAAK